MQYKLLVVKNRFTGKVKVQKYLDWFKKNTPIDVVIVDEMTTDFDVTPETISNATVGVKNKVYVCGDDILPKLKTLIPEGKYHAVVFLYGNKMPGIRVNVAKRMPLYPGTDTIQLVVTTDDGKTLNHELFHTFMHRLQRQQVIIEDPMDAVLIDGVWKYYYNNDALDAKPSNRTIAIERITQLKAWDKVAKILILNEIPKPIPPVTNVPPQLPVVSIKRIWDNGVQTLGDLSINGLFMCKTLERPWKENANNVSCIPKGEYRVKWSYSFKFMKYTYEVLSVPKRSGIRIHPGNHFFQVEGCILLGSHFAELNNDGYADIINSTITLDKFVGMMGKKDFILKII